jgi:hypothetical protein
VRSSRVTLLADVSPDFVDNRGGGNGVQRERRVVTTLCRLHAVDESGPMETNGRPVGGGEHWMALEGGADSPAGGGFYTSRFAAIGASVPSGGSVATS